MLNSIPKINKHIGVATIIEKYKVAGSVARMMLRKCLENGSLKLAEKHSRQALYYPAVAIADKVADPKAEGKKGKKGK